MMNLREELILDIHVIFSPELLAIFLLKKQLILNINNSNFGSCLYKCENWFLAFMGECEEDKKPIK
jgi:hypothetical protein